MAALPADVLGMTYTAAQFDAYAARLAAEREAAAVRRRARAARWQKHAASFLPKR